MTVATGERLLLRIPEAGESLGVSRAKVYEMISRGDLKVVRIDGSVRISVDELRRYVESLRAS